MRGVNKAIILGNCGGDPETRYTAQGTAITTVGVATSEQWTDKQTGQKQERTEWHRIKAFGRTAEIIGEYVKKGDKIYIEGQMRTDKYTDKEGVERYDHHIVVREVQLLGGGTKPQAGERPTRAEAASRKAPAPARTESAAPQGEVFEDDDVPF